MAGEGLGWKLYIWKQEDKALPRASEARVSTLARRLIARERGRILHRSRSWELRRWLLKN